MPPLIKHIIQITIVDDSKGEKCDAHCGVDWSSVDAIALANQRIKDRFGNRIQLEYLELSKPVANRRAPELKQRFKTENLPLPLLLINGEPRISGQFDIRQLLDAIDAEMEIESQL
jgi:disulfide oxidoreductase YuzD